VAGFCEHGDEPLSSIKKAGYFLISSLTISFSNTILHHGVSEYDLNGFILQNLVSIWSL
jgi:hypothetical protein